MIEAKGLVKRYDNHLAVDHLSFTIEKGHIVGFLGPNGAGKSTTMNMITGYIAATEGTVTINGHDIYEEPQEAKKCIGYLPELPPLYQNMKVREYLLFVAELKGVARDEKAAMVEEIIQRVHLEEYANRLIKQLSKGYKQRVGLAQAIVGYPEVLILDEPTVGLDPLQIIEIRELIKELAKKHTIILSSHIMQEISAVCDHIMIISHGKLVLSGTPEELQKQANQGENIELEAVASKEQVTAILERLEGVTEIAELSSESENSYAVSIRSVADIREKVFVMFAEAKLPLLKLVRTTKTLEDIFLEATSAQPGTEEEEVSEVTAESSEEAPAEESAEVPDETIAEEKEEKEEA